MELFHNTNFDFLGKKWAFIIASLVLTAAGLISLAVKDEEIPALFPKGSRKVKPYLRYTPQPGQ